MSSSKMGTSGVESSFDAFAKVDSIVSKPVLGSDGAASWQEFRKKVVKGSSAERPSAAPKAPLKKLDRLGAGFTSWEDERSHEDKVRKQSGHAETGAGYTTFKKKNSAEEAAERKRIKNIEAKIRPEEKEYFIRAQTFQGWKFDYIFTTRTERGTGYFWDGTDSIKKLRGELSAEEHPSCDITDQKKDENIRNAVLEEEGENSSLKPKKKKRKKSEGPVIISDPNNPMEQVAAIVQRRNQMLSVGCDLPAGWEATMDNATGKNYYFNRVSGERSWTAPEAPKSQGAKNSDTETPLPQGWSVAVDKASGNNYYFHTSGQTQWNRPTS
jgi:hypothetical protein